MPGETGGEPLAGGDADAEPFVGGDTGGEPRAAGRREGEAGPEPCAAGACQESARKRNNHC